MATTSSVHIREGEEVSMNTVLFSGRFDRCHCGHIATIQGLSKKFDCVIVVVLDYPEQKFPVEYRKEVLDTILFNSRGNYKVIVNKENYERISKEGAEQIKFDVYASGNEKCIEHMGSLGYKTMFVPRSWDYEASREK
jgi:cytidyltransferase-like protein